MTDDDSAFFQALGQRIAKLRKGQNLTQGQLAEHLGISQQHMASFEKGIRKVPASILPIVAKLFIISVDELVGLKDPNRASSARAANPACTSRIVTQN